MLQTNVTYQEKEIVIDKKITVIYGNYSKHNTKKIEQNNTVLIQEYIWYLFFYVELKSGPTLRW